MHIMLPHIIMAGMPVFIMAVIDSQHWAIISLVMLPMGFMVQTMASPFISQVMLQVIIDIIMGIIPPIMGFIIGICPPIIGFIMPIMGFIIGIWGIIGIWPGIIGMVIIGIAGIFLSPTAARWRRNSSVSV
jgi:hypothetical protein